MTQRCPVSGKTAAYATSTFAEAVGQCPFVSAALQSVPGSAKSDADAPAKPSCPHGFGSRTDDETVSSGSGAVCPMGFGSATPKDPLAALQCTRCAGFSQM